MNVVWLHVMECSPNLLMYMIKHPKPGWLKIVIIIYLSQKSIIRAELGGEGSSLLHVASARTAQLGNGWATFKMAHSTGWQVGAGCQGAAQPGWGPRPSFPVHVGLSTDCSDFLTASSLASKGKHPRRQEGDYGLLLKTWT